MLVSHTGWTAAAVTTALLVCSASCGGPAARQQPSERRGHVIELSRPALPSGFARVGPAERDVEDFFGPTGPGLVSSWLFEGELDEQGTLALIQLFRRRSTRGDDDTERWAHERAAALGGDDGEDPGIEGFDYVVAWRDPHGIAHAEWAWVPKGCERMEVYDRIADDGVAEWEIRVMLHPSAPVETTMRWLATTFDTNLGSSAPRARRSLRGLETRR